MTKCLKSKSKSLQYSCEVVRSVNEKRRIFDLLFLTKFAKKQHSELHSPRLEQPSVEEFICLRIDGGVQPVTVIIDRSLIRSAVAGRL